MLTDSKSYTTLDHGWIFRIRPPENPATARILLLIHGLTGDENSMWVFGRQIEGNYLILAPRAIYPANEYGYSWVEGSGFLHIDFLIPVIDRLLEQVRRKTAELHVDSDQPLNIMGFSQGAALAYSISILHSAMISRVAALAGFIPAGAEQYLNGPVLTGKKFFIAHGTADPTVPIEKARQAVSEMKQAGADVTFCEEQVGHRLGAGCFRDLKSFFSFD